MGTEVWDDGNIVNNDECTTPKSDGEASNSYNPNHSERISHSIWPISGTENQ